MTAVLSGVWRCVVGLVFPDVWKVNSAFIFMESGPVHCTLRSLQMRAMDSFETSESTQRHCVMSSNSRPSVEPQICLSLVSVVSHLSPVHTHTHTHTHRFFEFPYLHVFGSGDLFPSVLETKSAYAFRLSSMHATCPTMFRPSK